MKKQIVVLLLAFSVVIVFAAQHNSKADADLAAKDVKELTKAMTMYSEDFDDLLPANRKQVGEVYPYILGGNQLRPFPDDSRPTTAYLYHEFKKPIMILPAAIVFNPALFGANLDKVKTKPKVVMWSYGRPERLNFVFRGKSLVSFVDGTSKFVSKAEAKKLRWKP